MIRTTTFFIALLTFFQLSAQVIKGKIIDESSKDGVGFARVTLIDFQSATLTDDKGCFELEGRFPLVCRIRVTASGYEALTTEINSAEKIELYLVPIHLEIDEVSVTASGNELKRNSVSYVELKSVKELNDIPKNSLGQLIETIPGVYNSSTGIGIAKPVIRGLQGTRVLTLLNGVRLEGQQWGGDHGMGVSELGIETIEVLKGPASLQYGADALGGVLYLSNEHYANQNTHEITLSSQFESVSMGTTNALLYNGTVKNKKILVGGRFASHADYQIPGKQYVRNARFQDENAKLALGWFKGRWVGNVRYDWSNSTIGIPGHSHDSIPEVADFLGAKQLRKKTLPVQYLENHIAAWENKFVLDKHIVQLLTSFTWNRLTEHEEKHTIPELKMNTLVTPFKLNVTSFLAHNWQLNYGWQGMYVYQKNAAIAMDRLIPDAQQLDNGLYTIATWNKNQLKFQIGGRADMRWLSAKADEKFTSSFEKNYVGFNFSSGINYAFTKQHLLRLNVSSGFRIPHLSELLSNGVHHGSFRYEIGERNLKTEKALQVDASYEFSGEHLSVIVNPFINGIGDFIFIQPTNTKVENVPVYEYRQASRPVVQVGSDLGVHWHPHFAHILHLESTFSYLNLFAKTSDAYSLIPQPRWTNTIIARFEMKSKFKLDNAVINYTYFLPQHKVSNFESTSVDYGVLDLGLQASLSGKFPFQLQVGVKNLTNTRYIDHLSRLKNIGIANPARSFYVKLIINLKY